MDPRRSFTLITQNVDGYHQIAGSQRVLEVHGNLRRTRCDAECGHPAFIDDQPHVDAAPRCPGCGGVLRPDVVLFGEYLPVDVMHLAKTAARSCDLFVAIGTSGSVMPVSGLMAEARISGARTVLVDPGEEAGARMEPDAHFIGSAEDLVPLLFA